MAHILDPLYHWVRFRKIIVNALGYACVFGRKVRIKRNCIILIAELRIQFELKAYASFTHVLRTYMACLSILAAYNYVCYSFLNPTLYYNGD